VRFLIDTNVISETRRARADRRVKAWLDLWPDADLALSAVTFGEIQEGIVRLDAGVKRTALTRWLEDELIAKFGERVLPVNLMIAREWGRLAGEGRRAGRTLPPADGLLLATAAIHGLELVTRNERDLAGRGVNIVNPWR
jgi:predicted nucleic acid-binding protein